MKILINNLKVYGVKGELHSNHILLYFAVIGLEWDSLTLLTIMNFFSSKTPISTPFAQDIYGLLFANMNILLMT